jgi:riboflavin kinase/FMN adenylyltransferase
LPPVVVHGSERYRSGPPDPVVVVGNFDGVHRGHRALLDTARARAGVGPVCVYTFDPFPRDVLGRGSTWPALQAVEDRVAALGEAGADEVVVERFTLDYAAHDALWFCTEILGRRLHAAAVVVGFNFRFGRGRDGDVEHLAAALPVPVVAVPAIEIGGAPVSSTRVRQALATGEIALATTLLGRAHEVVGTVVRGDARGRTLGFPTANVRVERGLMPAAGVYAVRAVTPDGHERPGVANLGVRPTFGATEGRLEVHLFDVDLDLYDAPLRVRFVQRLREERAFPGLDALVAQIRADAAAARAVLGCA